MSEGDVETHQATTTWTVGPAVDHQQVGNTWAGAENIISLSLNGELNIFDRRVGDKPTHVLYVSHMSYHKEESTGRKNVTNHSV
jgi:WD repeat-containing protein 1 (actin-interacting protein 1)